MKLDTFGRHPLLFGPSPVHRLERLTTFLGGAEVWAKREDCNSGLAFGGNKTRKLEYLERSLYLIPVANRIACQYIYKDATPFGAPALTERR
jgi:hypothetical protein